MTRTAEHLRLVDADGHPRPGQAFASRARLRPGAEGACPYPLLPGTWYALDGRLPMLQGGRRLWLVVLDPGEPGVPIDEHQLELGPDDPEAFQRTAAELLAENVEATPIPRSDP